MRAISREICLGKGAKGFAHHWAGAGIGRQEHLRNFLLFKRWVGEANKGGHKHNM